MILYVPTDDGGTLLDIIDKYGEDLHCKWDLKNQIYENLEAFSPKKTIQLKDALKKYI